MSGADPSSPHGAKSGGLLDGLFARGAAADAVTDGAVVQAMLDFELALMRALVRAGRAPEAAAEELARIARAERFDLAELGSSSGAHGTPVPGLLAALRRELGEAGAAHLHVGATSQDVVDSALMLTARRALAPILKDLRRAAGACARLAERHRESLAPGRTLLQHALPITFGLKAAGWLDALDGARVELATVRDHVLAVQLGGAVGTLAALGDGSLQIVEDVADQLGLSAPRAPWHTVRLRPARLACALASALGVAGKIAVDIVLLAQTEVDEAAEGPGCGRGASSTMPHKQNPIGAVAVIACAKRAPGLAATILSGMLQEHERAAGSWQSEWEPMLELLRLTGSAAEALSELVDGLAVDVERMRANLDLSGEQLMSESVAGALGASLGRSRAQELVARASRQAAREHRRLRDVLLEVPEVAECLSSASLDRALDPRHYLGVTSELIDRTLAAHARLLDDDAEA